MIAKQENCEFEHKVYDSCGKSILTVTCNKFSPLFQIKPNISEQSTKVTYRLSYTRFSEAYIN